MKEKVEQKIEKGSGRGKKKGVQISNARILRHDKTVHYFNGERLS